jgi:hypothetical protein
MSGQTKITPANSNAHFDPETVAVLRTALDDAWATLPEDIQAKTNRSALAVSILKEAANGERDPECLRAAALMEVADELSRSTTTPHQLRCRDRAQRCRGLASQSQNDHLKRRFLLLAENYEAAALEKTGPGEADPILKLLAFKS